MHAFALGTGDAAVRLPMRGAARSCGKGAYFQMSETQSLARRVDAALFGSLLDTSHIPIIGTVVGGVLVTFGLWRPDNGAALLGWLGLMLAIIVWRLWLARHCRRKVSAGFDARVARAYCLSLVLPGTLWGLAGFFAHDGDLTARVVMITVLQAMTMGGVNTLAIYFPAFLCFTVPALLLLSLSLLRDGDHLGLFLALYGLFFLFAMIVIGRRTYLSLRRNWELTFEREDLIAALTLAHDQLALRAETDGLTGLANRRRFDEALNAEYQRFRRSGAPLTLILLDVDYFKQFNDTHGHLEGDRCLQAVAAVLQQVLHRPADIAARYGGEEFALILPETGVDGALAVAEGLRGKLEELAIPHGASSIAACVTISVGVATVGDTALASPLELVAAADRELYRAKSEGRNRVCATQL